MNKAEMWERLEPTDPARTKPFQKGGGFRGTAINATYILKKLTEEFGPCGKGWKFVLEDERIEEGHTLKSGDKAKLHIVRGHIEYIIDTAWCATSPQFGQTMLVDENKNGTFTDEEAPKKSITDCISKCAVLLGIGADVHLGLFDDNKYVNQRKAEEAAENGNGHGNGHVEPNPPQGISPPAVDRKAAVTQWANNTIGAVQQFKTLDALNSWHAGKDAGGFSIRDRIAAVRGVNESLHKRLIDAIAKKAAEFSGVPLAAE